MASERPRLNAAWHKANRMPARATLEQRVAWHVEHYRHCACREIPPKLAEQMKQLGVKLPKVDRP